MKFTIITAAYNASRTISDTITSVAAQRFTDFEHIVVDGASRDGTQDVVAKLAHPRLRLVSEADRGCYDAMNKGIALAAGKIVSFLNADDFLAGPNVLARVDRAFIESGGDCVVGQTAVVDQHDVRKVRRLYGSQGYRPWMLRFGHMPPHPSFYATRVSLEAAGGFDLRYRIAADFDLMVKLLLKNGATLAAIEDTLSVFRQGGISTRNIAAKRQINREIALSLRRNGIRSASPLLWARYPFKALQMVRKPRDYPLGES